MPLLDLGGVDVFYQDDGPEEEPAGAPIVMIHGFARNGNFWRTWVPRLSRGHRVIRIDIRGCGQSPPRPDYTYTLDAVVDDYLSLLDRLEVEGVHHIGESTGGVVGAFAAAQAPNRFYSLTLACTPTTPNTDDNSKKAPGGSSPTESMAALGLREWWKQSRVLTEDVFGDSRDDEYADEFARTPVHVALAMFSGMHHPDVTLERVAASIKTPTLLLTPGASTTMTVESQVELAASILGCRHKIYNDAPHGIYYLRGDELAQDALPFIDQHDPTM